MPAESAPQNVKKTQAKQVATKAPVVIKQAEKKPPSQAKYLQVSPVNNSTPQSIAQASANDPRQALKIDLLPTVAGVPDGNSPNIGFGIPSAFGASWGDAFISMAGATAGKSRGGQIDGSVSTGFGIGDAKTSAGLELGYNVGSINYFGANGTFDAKLHRIVYDQDTNKIAVAAGIDAFAQHGNEGERPSSVYGLVSSYTLLQPDDDFNKMPISFSFGVGNGNYRQNTATVGVFGGVGVQVHPQLSVGAAWSGVGINLGISYVPVPSIPLTIGLMGADLTENSIGGRVLILGLSYGFNFLPR
jgi:hypothetical protein